MARHYIITNREIINEHSAHEHIRPDGKEEARDELRFGYYDFNENKPKDEGKITLYADLKDKQKQDLAEKGVKPKTVKLGSEQVFENVYQSMVSNKGQIKGDTLVYIHGFKSDLDKALTTVRRLHKVYVEDAESPIENIVLFTWPARQNILRYRDDARDARISGYALGRSFMIFRDFLLQKFGNDAEHPKSVECNHKIHLIVHSMGNQVLESMLQFLTAQTGSRIPSFFDQIVLVGSDIDYDAMENPRPMYKLIDICQRVHIYHHNNDIALQISQRTKHAYNRLGLCGTKNYKLLPDNVFEVNVSHTREDNGWVEKAVNHWYYYNTKEVVKDIIAVFRGSASVVGS